MSLSQAIKEAYASAPLGQVNYDTIEVRHPSFKDDAGLPTAIRVVIGYEDIIARLEPEAPLNGGEYVTFVAGAFNLTLPGFKEGEVPQLQLSLDNVSREITGYLESAAANPKPIEVTYRPYLSGDLSGPQMDPPVTMVMTSIQAGVFQVTGTATMDDVNNWPFPSKTYTPDRFPGLVR